MARDISATALLHATNTLAYNASELISYLDYNTLNQLNDDFNILHW